MEVRCGLYFEHHWKENKRRTLVICHIFFTVTLLGAMFIGREGVPDSPERSPLLQVGVERRFPAWVPSSLGAVATGSPTSPSHPLFSLSSNPPFFVRAG